MRSTYIRFLSLTLLAAVGIIIAPNAWRESAVPNVEGDGTMTADEAPRAFRDASGGIRSATVPEAVVAKSFEGVDDSDGTSGFREEIWEDFAYPAVLSREVNGHTVHKVANHLVITARGGHAILPLKAWASAESGRSVRALADGTWLAEWAETSAEAHMSHRRALAEALGDAAVVEPDWIVRAASVPNDPLYASRQRHFELMFAPDGWSVRTDAGGIVVAVLDTGVDRTHPDLINRVRPRPGELPGTGRDDDGNGFIDDVYGWDFIDNNNDPRDPDGHGTHVAGLIGAEGNNQLWGTGVAWDVTLLPVRFLDHNGVGTTSDEIRALDYARVSGARIVNASYGGPGFSEGVLARLRALEDAGIWVVAAAGNDSADTDRSPVYPAAHGLSNMISVGAGDPERDRAGFSNYGRESVDLFAPGSGIYSIEPNGQFPSRSGTSYSTALVSGALALVLAEYPQAARQEIRSRIVDRVRFSPGLAEQSRSEGFLDLGHTLAPGPGRAPRIVESPVAEHVRPGASVTLSVRAVSSAGTTVQWLRDGEPIPGATHFNFSINRFDEADEGLYQARVSDLFGEALSEPAPVQIDRRPPSIVRMPGAASFTPGGELRVFVEAESASEIEYQWFFNGEPIAGATSPEFVIPTGGTESAGDYFVRVSNPYGHVDSQVIPVGFGGLTEDAWESVVEFPDNGATIYGGDIFNVGCKAFRYEMEHGLFRIDSFGVHHRVPFLEEFLYFVGSNGRQAVFVPIWMDENRLYILDAEARFEELTDLPFEIPPTYWQMRGTGFIARESFPGHVADGEPLWLSPDGRQWEEDAGLPFRPDQITRGPGAWVAVFDEESAGERYVRVHRRPDSTGQWESVLELPLPDGIPRPGRPQSNDERFVFSVGSEVYSSADGLSWETSNTRFSTFSLSEHGMNHLELFFASARLERIGGRALYASRDGLDWFLTSRDAHPFVTTGGAGFRITTNGRLERARLDGTAFPDPLRVRVEGDSLVREAPASWEILATVEEPDEVVRIELWRDDTLVATRDAQDARFTVEADEPFIGVYTVRAYYEDGWVSVSGGIPLRVFGGRVSSVKDLPGLSGARMESVHYYPSGGFIFARSINSLAHLEDGPFQRSSDAVDWTPLTSELEQGTHYRRLLLTSGGTPLLLQNGSHRHTRVGSFVSEIGVVDLHVPEAAEGFAHAPFVFDGSVHLLALSGDLFRLRSDRSWEFLRNTRPTEDFDPERTGSQPPLRVDSGNGLHVLRVGDTGESGITSLRSARLLTRDFVTYAAVPHLEHRTFGGITFDGAELLYLSNDRRAIAFVGEDGRVLRETAFPLPVDRWEYIGDGTLVASADGLAFLASHYGSVWPIDTPNFENTTFWRDSTRLGLFGHRGEIRLLAVQDFRVAAVRAPDIEYGPENRLRGNVTVRHAGGMSTGDEVRLAVRAFLQPADTDDDAVPLGSQSVDASRWHPGRNRTFQLEWSVPTAIRLGEYALMVEINYDDAVDEADTSGNLAGSPPFIYVPSPSVVLETAPFGHAVSDQVGTHVPYGSTIRIEARPEPGFRFIGWDGTRADSQPHLDLSVDQPHRLRPRFVPEIVAAAFPWIKPVSGGDWFADASGLFFATVSGDWSYHYSLGWFRIGEVAEAGSWLWFPDSGWRFRPSDVEAYFDPADRVWEIMD